MKTLSTLVLAILLSEATPALAQTCELRIGGSVDLPRSCVATPTIADSEPRTTRTASPPSYRMEVAIDMSPTLFDWIRESWGGGPTTKSGTLRLFSPAGDVGQVIEFSDAYIAETSFPTLDVQNRGRAYFGIKIQPASATKRKDDGPQPIEKRPREKARDSLASNFRLVLSGLPTTRVFRITSFTWRRSNAFPNLAVTIGMRDYKGWSEWTEATARSGSNNATNGYVAFLATDGATELGRLALEGVVVRSLRPDLSTRKSFEAELGVYRMRLERP